MTDVVNSLMAVSLGEPAAILLRGRPYWGRARSNRFLLVEEIQQEPFMRLSRVEFGAERAVPENLVDGRLEQQILHQRVVSASHDDGQRMARRVDQVRTTARRGKDHKR